MSKKGIHFLLQNCNPYFFIEEGRLTVGEIVRKLADAFISSNKETIFGDWLEGLAIFIIQKVYGGWKSGITGIDLEFDKDGTRFIVTIKSGPNWGNSSQISKMKGDFNTAARTLRTSNSGLVVLPVNGCCYGKDSRPDKGDYFKYCGQDFWHFISGDENLYKELVEPLGHKAREKNDMFYESYSAMINSLCKKTPTTALFSFLKQLFRQAQHNAFTIGKLLGFKNIESLVFGAFLSNIVKAERRAKLA